jgi:hypothetical protein
MLPIARQLFCSNQVPLFRGAVQSGRRRHDCCANGKVQASAAVKVKVYVTLRSGSTYNSNKKCFKERQVPDNDTFPHPQCSIEALKELVQSQQGYIRQIEHERDVLLAWICASAKPPAELRWELSSGVGPR